MPANRNKPDQWKADIKASVDQYNAWFMEFAPQAFQNTRGQTAQQVEDALIKTDCLRRLTPQVLMETPQVLPMLRMSTCPPIARDRLVGLAGVSKGLVENMENRERPRLPPRMPRETLMDDLGSICETIQRMADPDIFVWLGRKEGPQAPEIQRASNIVADRLCGSLADPIIRNAQERRQLAAVSAWLEESGYRQSTGIKFDRMQPGSYAFRVNVPVALAGEGRQMNIPVNVAIMPHDAAPGALPLMLEAKSAGDFTNVNKRRKEEAQKMHQLRATYGERIRYTLFLCGYFDSGYLGYEAAEGIDWIWEHRVEDLKLLGV